MLEGRLRSFVVVSFVLLAVRLAAARVVGFGDSEALYACYALHPQPAYLDHPGLVGLFARALAGGAGAPTPHVAHTATAVFATLVPLLVVGAARWAGAAREASWTAGLVAALVPELAVGLFAMTPDVLLAVAWLLGIGLALRALAGDPKSHDATACFVGAGLCAGVACTAKASGVLLFAALSATYLGRHARRSGHARTIAPWAGLAVALVAVAPVVSYEAQSGWPMLRHRLVDSQTGAGWTLRNVGAVVGGQLTYVSPILAAIAVFVAADLVKRRRDDAASALLFHAFAIPFVPLLALSLWSAVAEPHWLAPAWLVLPVHASRMDFGARPRLVAWTRAGAALAAVMVAAVHAWVLVPSFASAASSARWNIARELFGWEDPVAAVRDLVQAEKQRGEDIVVAGPHWVICAQLHAALGAEVRVGCATPIPDDFDGWEPRARWQSADEILWVTDDRFEAAAPPPSFVVAARSRVTVLRGGRVMRVFTLTLLESRARG